MGGGIWLCLDCYRLGFCGWFGFRNHSPLGQLQGLAEFHMVGIAKIIEGDEVLLTHLVAHGNGAKGLSTGHLVTACASSDPTAGTAGQL